MSSRKVVINGVTYIRSRDAARIANYAPDYDRAHFPAYMFLLDWSAAGADWRDTMIALMGDEIVTDPVRAKSMYDAHLVRAQRMTQTGWRLLLQDKAS